MKKVTAILFLLIATLQLFSQTAFSKKEIVDFRIRGELEVPIIVSDNSIILSFLFNYEKNITLNLIIPTTQVNTFKTQIRELEKKFNEWEEVARTNNVQRAQKEMPVNLSAIYDNIKGNKLHNPQEKSVKANFFVKEGKAHCVIYMLVSGNGEKIICLWPIGANDFSKIIKEVDNAIKKQNEQKLEKERVEDLFH